MNAIIYGRTTPPCPYCEQAKQLLTNRGIAFDFYEVDKDVSKEEIQAIFPGARQVPQIIIDGVPISGGFTGLKKLLGVD